MPHTTPRSLNDNLRLARLTVPQWLAAVVGGASLWGDALLARGIHNPNMHIIAIAAPAVVLVTPILAFGRGGIEHYPQQATRYTMRRARRALVHAIALAQTQLANGKREAPYPGGDNDSLVFGPFETTVESSRQGCVGRPRAVAKSAVRKASQVVLANASAALRHAWLLEVRGNSVPESALVPIHDNWPELLIGF